jgi:hypothetical protein
MTEAHDRDSGGRVLRPPRCDVADASRASTAKIRAFHRALRNSTAAPSRSTARSVTLPSSRCACCAGHVQWRQRRDEPQMSAIGGTFRTCRDSLTMSAHGGWSQQVDATLYLKGEMECMVMGGGRSVMIVPTALDFRLHSHGYPLRCYGHGVSAARPHSHREFRSFSCRCSPANATAGWDGNHWLRAIRCI